MGIVLGIREIAMEWQGQFESVDHPGMSGCVFLGSHLPLWLLVVVLIGRYNVDPADEFRCLHYLSHHNTTQMMLPSLMYACSSAMKMLGTGFERLQDHVQHPFGNQLKHPFSDWMICRILWTSLSSRNKLNRRC